MSMSAVPVSSWTCADELQDLGLDRHVERGGRLVGDEELRVAGERHGDHDALAHAAGQLVRVLLARAARGSWMPDRPERLDGPLACRLLADLHVLQDRLGDLVADREHRVEAASSAPGRSWRCRCPGRCRISSFGAALEDGRRPSNQIVAAMRSPARAAISRRRMIVRAVTLLPQPDSPTMPSVSPRLDGEATPSTAWTMPSITWK